MGAIPEPTAFGSTVRAWLSAPENADTWINIGYGIWTNRFRTTGITWNDLTVLEVLPTVDTAKRWVAETIVDAAKDHAIDGQVRITELIHIANDAIGHTNLGTVGAIKAQALREAAEAQRGLARQAKTSNGKAEHEDRADWLDDRANALEPRLEEAHP